MVGQKGIKSVIVNIIQNENLHVTVMLAALSDGQKLPLYIILK